MDYGTFSSFRNYRPDYLDNATCTELSLLRAHDLIFKMAKDKNGCFRSEWPELLRVFETRAVKRRSRDHGNGKIVIPISRASVKKKLFISLNDFWRGRDRRKNLSRDRSKKIRWPLSICPMRSPNDRPPTMDSTFHDFVYSASRRRTTKLRSGKGNLVKRNRRAANIPSSVFLTN